MSSNNADGEYSDPTEKYQQDLLKFIAAVPSPSVPEVASGRIVPNEKNAILSGKPFLPSPTREKIDALQGKIETDARFRTLTGWEHKALLEKWLGDKTTTCNEFCQRCANAMGVVLKDGVGRFDIAERLVGQGLSHVWVPATGDAKPEYGDIFRLYEANPDHNKVPTNHMGVSLHIHGDEWFTVESGQGGSALGYDAIMRKKRRWKPSSLRGWVSTRALLNAGKPLPFWLGGWWQVEEDPYDTYYYYFAAGGKVTYSTIRPTVFTAGPLHSHTIGTCSMKGMYGLSLSWHGHDADENFTLALQDAAKRVYVMEGRNARGIGLRATRLMSKEAYG